MAISTPAQKPRGAASSTVSTIGVVGGGVASSVTPPMLTACRTVSR